MSVSYNRLWKLLIDKKMSQSELRKEAGIAPNTMTKLRRDEAVNLAILGRICDVLDCDFGDIMEHKCIIIRESRTHGRYNNLLCGPSVHSLLSGLIAPSMA